MAYSFKNILIAVDLSINTEVLIKKALELADSDTTIHLLHVEPHGTGGLFTILKRYLAGRKDLIEKQEIKNKIGEWMTIEESSVNIKVCNWIVEAGSIQGSIEKKAIELGVDIIIIGKNSDHSWLPFLKTVHPGELIKNTGIAVLTVTPGATLYKVRKVVIPILGNESIQHKMDMISTLCRKFRLNIHLLTFMSRNHEGTDITVSLFLRSYQYLKLNNPYPVEYAVLCGNNKAKAILKYAEKIRADILLVHPGSETKTGWPNKNISDMLPAASGMNILAV